MTEPVEKGHNGIVLSGVILVALIVAGGAAWMLRPGAVPAPAPAPVAAVPPAPEAVENADAAVPEADPVETDPVETESAESAPQDAAPAPGPAAPEAQETARAQTPAPAAETTAEAPASEPAIVPSFDVVRVAPDGAALVAGKAAPGAEVTVQLGADAAATTVADARGQFVAQFDVAPGAVPQAMSLTTKDTQGVEASSAQTVIVAPVAEPAPATPDTALAAATPAAPAPAPEEPETPVAEEADAPQAPAVVLADESGVKVLQGGAAPDKLVIEAISYSAEGAVVLAGRAAPGAFVRLYLNNTALGTVQSAEDGRWSGTFDEIAPGIYTLRADQVDAAGKVLARTETPFKREAPAALAEALAPADPAPAAQAPAADVAAADSNTPATAGTAPTVQVVTVQPGFTLWGIAQERYGDGLLYVQVFEANKGQIRDPDLIYPGQVFDVPELQ